GQVGATILRVHLELAAARVDVLSPEALPVEQPDRDQLQSQVAGRLQVVTREYTEPAGIDRQALRKPELEREVRDGHWRLRVHEARVALVILAVGGASTLERLTHLFALACALDALLAELGEQQHGIFARRVPECGVKSAEKGFDPGLPRPRSEEHTSELQSR